MYQEKTGGQYAVAAQLLFWKPLQSAYNRYSQAHRATANAALN